MHWFEPLSFVGETIRLEPLAEIHEHDLIEAARDGELWNLWYTSVPDPTQMNAEIVRRLALATSGSMVPFAVIERATNKAVGMTTYMNVDAVNRRVEIGSTWYRKSSQRTGINTEAKILLLTHAFDRIGCIAVEFRTSSFNRQSRVAIERLGAKHDGILRSHAVHANGTLRDTYVYSITAAEWPTVRAHLQSKSYSSG